MWPFQSYSPSCEEVAKQKQRVRDEAISKTVKALGKYTEADGKYLKATGMLVLCYSEFDAHIMVI